MEHNALYNVTSYFCLHVIYVYNLTHLGKRDERMWKLKDLLVAAGEPPLTAYTTDIDSGDFIVLHQQQVPIPPCAVGTMLHILQLGEHRGLPKWLSIDERRCLRLAIVNALHMKN